MTSFVKKEVLDGFRRGSYEERIELVKEACEVALDKAVNVIATDDMKAIVIDEDGNFHQLKYAMGDGEISEATIHDFAVGTVDEESMDAEVAKELRAVVDALIEGQDVSRTQVRVLASMVEKGQLYWLSDVLKELHENLTGSWQETYTSNREAIRKGLQGKLQKLEGQVPSTRYAKLGKKLPGFEFELRESMRVLAGVAQQIVDSAGDLVFNDDEEGATHQALIAEARALRGLLCKAERLMRTDDLGRVAETHDGLAERTKEMLVMAEHLKVRSQHAKEESK